MTRKPDQIQPEPGPQTVENGPVAMEMPGPGSAGRPDYQLAPDGAARYDPVTHCRTGLARPCQGRRAREAGLSGGRPLPPGLGMTERRIGATPRAHSASRTAVSGRAPYLPLTAGVSRG